jgi:hypothetical protein
MEKEELGKLAFDRFIDGAKSDTARDYWFAKFQKEQENRYSEEDMMKAFETGRNFQLTGENNFKELIEQLKKQNKL